MARKLGMSEYAQRFAENGIDLGVLPDLTDQDLKEIGVLLGHRRKLLRAIADLGSAGAAEHVPAPASAAPVTAPTSAPAEASGERRHVTVMFCDLVVTRDYRGYARRSGRPFCRAKSFSHAHLDVVQRVTAAPANQKPHRPCPGAVWPTVTLGFI